MQRMWKISCQRRLVSNLLAIFLLMIMTEEKTLVDETRTATHDRTTKGTLRWQEDVVNDQSVFRTIYVEKWTLPEEVKNNPEDYYVEVNVKVFKR